MDRVGEEYAERRGEGNSDMGSDSGSDEGTRALKEMMAVKEDKLRYSQIYVLKVVGMAFTHFQGFNDACFICIIIIKTTTVTSIIRFNLVTRCTVWGCVST